MSSTYGWLTESALAIERPVPLRGVSQQSQRLLSEIVRQQRENQQIRIAHERPLFEDKEKAGKVFTHDAENDGVELRKAADEAERSRRKQHLSNIESHLENKSKLYDRIVGGLSHSSSASLLLQLRQKRRNVQKKTRSQCAHQAEKELVGPQLSAEALTELIALPEGPKTSAEDLQLSPVPSFSS
ncbi:hypothetical protein Efla_006924 [Eimeria flavescens]